MHKIILDTDAGYDDALAIFLLLGTPGFAPAMLTTVAGNSTIENVTRNACSILDLAGRRDIPVHSGEARPLDRELSTSIVHGGSGLDGLDTTGTRYILDGEAVDRIIACVRDNPGEVRIVAIGPLTNIARAFLKDPALPSMIRDVTIMGGAIGVPGNKSRVAEFNMFVDPEAADIVLRAPVRKTMIPLDVCNTVTLPLRFFEDLSGNVLRAPLVSMMSHLIGGLGMQDDALVYDAVAAYALINPQAFSLADMDIVVETGGQHTVGMTVAERRKRPETPNISVATAADAAKFRSDLRSALQDVALRVSAAA